MPATLTRPALLDRASVTAWLEAEGAPAEVLAWVGVPPRATGITYQDLPDRPFVLGHTNCPVCDGPVPLPVPGKAGRPKETCSITCRDLYRLLLTVELLLGEVQDRASPQAWLKLRGKLWTALNARAWNRAVSRRGLAR